MLCAFVIFISCFFMFPFGLFILVLVLIVVIVILQSKLILVSCRGNISV